MINQVSNIGISELLRLIMIFLLTGNIIYVIYVFIKKRIYHDKLLLTFAIYFCALIIEPVSASIKFNVKYGFGIIDFLYLGALVYIVFIAIIRNNIFFFYNMSWEEFYKVTKEVFRREGVNTYYREPTIYINNGEATITNSAVLFSKKAIIVKIKGLNDIMPQETFSEKMQEYKINFGISKYSYLGLNIVITAILLLNTIY